MPTIYTFHRPDDHEILATAEPGTLQHVAANIAARIHRGLPDGAMRKTRLYVHNGRGIVAAGLCHGGAWHDIAREPYHANDDAAREKRAAAHWPNDPK